MSCVVKSEGDVVHVVGEMTIYDIAAIRTELLNVILQQPNPVLDLSAVTEFDTAGLQLVFMAQRVCAQHEKLLRFGPMSEAVEATWRLLHLAMQGTMVGAADT